VCGERLRSLRRNWELRAGESSYVWDMCYLRRMKYCDSRDRKEGTLLSLRNGSHRICKGCWRRSRAYLGGRSLPVLVDCSMFFLLPIK